VVFQQPLDVRQQVARNIRPVAFAANNHLSDETGQHAFDRGADSDELVRRRLCDEREISS